MLSISLNSCKKDDAGLPPYDVQVTLNNGGTKYVADDKIVAAKDSLLFDYVITTSKNMKYVSFQKNGTDLFRDTLTGSIRNTYSSMKRLVADSAIGVYTFRILAKDSAGVFLGDKTVTVTVTADFTYYIAKTLSVPDSTTKTNPCYFSTSTGQIFSYTNAAANSALIDFGYFYDTTTANKHTIYALNVNPVSFYDVTAFTKNATIFKKLPTSVSFTAIASGSQIKSIINTNFTTGTASKITALSAAAGSVTTAANNVFGFKTASGKMGIVLIAFISADSPNATTFANIEVKIAY